MTEIGAWGSFLSPQYFPGSQFLRSFGVHGVGNCFFDSIACAMNLNRYHARTLDEREQIGLQLRKKVARRLAREGERGWDRFWNRRRDSIRTSNNAFPNYVDVVRQVEDPSVWASAPLIVYVMAKLNLNHLFLDDTSESLYCGVANFALHDRPLLIILWKNSQHFEPVADPNAPVTDMLFAYNSPVFKRARKAYESGRCARAKAFLGGAKPSSTVFSYAYDASVPSDAREDIDGILREYGWPGFVYRRQTQSDMADAIVHFSPNEEIVARFGTRFDHMNVCMLSIPRHIFFNADLWDRANFHQSKSSYKQYVVLHEFGHAHGYDHENAVPQMLCDVMVPQSGHRRPKCIPSAQRLVVDRKKISQT